MLNTADTRHTVMPRRILFSPELFHIGIVCLLLWQMPSPQRSLGHSLFKQKFSQKFLCFSVLFCCCFLCFFILSKFPNYKILNGHYDINWEDFFTLDTDRTHNTRGHSKKLVKHRTLTSLRQKSFCYRVVDHWNNLTEEILTAKTVTSFKTLLDKHLVNERFDTFEIY